MFPTESARLEALKLAISVYGGDHEADDIVALAQTFIEFITKES